MASPLPKRNSNIDLISCRNVLIYFAPTLQKRVRAIFHYSLNPSSFLWLGSSESIGETSELFEITDNKHKVYSRKTVVNQMNFDFVSSEQAALTLQQPEDGSPRENPNYSNVQRQADQIVLNRYAPVGVVINEQFDILHFPFFRSLCHSAGEYTRDEDGDGFCEVHVNTMEGF